MNAPPSRPGDEPIAHWVDLELDVVFALEPLNEAIDVAFLAVKSAQQAIRGVPDTASSMRFRDEWRTANVLTRQALRLIDERAQELAKALKRLPHSG